MNDEETRLAVMRNLIEKADRSLAAARRDRDAGDLGLAINRVYYACFHALSALLLKEKQRFVKHTGVRGALHQHLVRAGRVPVAMGQFYDRAFAERHESDYNAMATFDAELVAERIVGAEQFVAEMKRLLAE